MPIIEITALACYIAVGILPALWYSYPEYRSRWYLMIPFITMLTSPIILQLILTLASIRDMWYYPYTFMQNLVSAFSPVPLIQDYGNLYYLIDKLLSGTVPQHVSALCIEMLILLNLLATTVYIGFIIYNPIQAPKNTELRQWGIAAVYLAYGINGPLWALASLVG